MSEKKKKMFKARFMSWMVEWLLEQGHTSDYVVQALEALLNAWDYAEAEG